MWGDSGGSIGFEEILAGPEGALSIDDFVRSCPVSDWPQLGLPVLANVPKKGFCHCRQSSPQLFGIEIYRRKWRTTS